MENDPLNPPPASPLPAPPPASSGNEKNLAMLCHLIAFSGLLVPFGNLLGPLVLWLIKKDTMPAVNEHGKESLNFQITVSIAMVLCFLTFWLVLPILLAIVIGLGAIVLTIIASIKASEGILYRYPFTLRLVK